MGAWPRKQVDVCCRGAEARVESRKAGDNNGAHDARSRRTERTASGEQIPLPRPAMLPLQWRETSEASCHARHPGGSVRYGNIFAGTPISAACCLREPQPASTEQHCCLAWTLLRRTHRRQGGVNASSTYDIVHSVGHFCDSFTVANKGVPRKPHIRARAVPRPLATASQTWETQHRSHDGLSGSNSARTCTPRRPMRFRCGPEGVFLCSDPVMAA